MDLGFLGDTVPLVPALWEIKRQYPDAALHVFSSTVGAEVLHANAETGHRATTLYRAVQRKLRWDPKKRALRRR